MKRFLFLSLLLVTAACSPTSRSPAVSNEEALQEIRIQKEIAAREHMEQLERLYRVGMPILGANADLCSRKIWPHTGIMLESLSSVPEKFKDAMQIFYGLDNQLTAAYVVEGTPAYGKILPGDKIVKINGVWIPSGSRGKKIYYETVVMDDKDIRTPLTFTVERGRKNKREEITIQPTPACASLITLEESDELNAWSDGIEITFTTAMMREAQNDSTLAYIFGHELAHNARLHMESAQINAALAQIASIIIEEGTGVDFSDLLNDIGIHAFSQDFETEADYIGLYMMARAGYDPEKGMEFARRMAALHPDAIHIAGSDHPSTAKRFLSLKKTVAEIRQKQARGEPLFPAEKSAPEIFHDLEKVN